MSVLEIKEQLHHAIDIIEDEKFLEALLTITSIQHEPQDYSLTEEQIRILEERHEQYLKGEIKTIPIEEVNDQMILEEREARYQSGEMKARPWKEIQEETKKKYGF